MEFITEWYIWLKANYIGVLTTASIITPTLYFIAEFIVRKTPTKTDDTILERVGSLVRKLYDYCGIRSVKKKEGTVLTPDGVHTPRPANSATKEEPTNG